MQGPVLFLLDCGPNRECNGLSGRSTRVDQVSPLSPFLSPPFSTLGRRRARGITGWHPSASILHPSPQEISFLALLTTLIQLGKIFITNPNQTQGPGMIGEGWGIWNGWMRRGISGLVLLGGLLGLLFHTGRPESTPGLALLETGTHAEAAESTAPYRVFLPLVLRAPAVPSAEWLSRLNAYRAMAGLPPVTEKPEWNDGCIKHARYMVKNDVITHAEDPQNRWYTPEGDQCGRNANVMVSASATASDAYAIDVWMQAPFHAIGMIDPQLIQVGYGSYREADGGYQMGAALDVWRGRGTSPAGLSFPIRWPGDGAITPLRAFQVGEYPDPLAHCGYTRPAGLPILLLLGTGSITPSVTDHHLRRDGIPVEHCVFDETTYRHPTDRNQQDLGRLILNSRDAVVIIPRDPLSPGSRYTVSVTANGQTYTWSFSVALDTAQMTVIEAAQEWDTQTRPR